jgi:DNA mismatch repair protein MutL
VSRIVVLSPELASQIAAGEVVERPASAAKELVENSLDAGATRVEVEIDGGGITRLAVVDDGEGMAADDAELAIMRHATSKIRSFDDLRTVGTFGYRGEALPSIASVSRLRLRTRAKGSDTGIEVTVEGGGAATVGPVGMPVGTQVEVRDLFFNVPARRKFLRAAATESGHVGDMLEALALARPDVTLTLSRDGRRVREWLRAPSREERVRQWLGDEVLARCHGERGPLGVEAFLSRPERARAGAAGLVVLVNGRVVKDRALALTVAQAYGSVLERGRYPRGAVYLGLPPELVDVNVHPQKSEVRFADPRAVSDALYGILSRELAGAFSLPAPARSPWAPAPAAARAADTPPVQSNTAEPDPWGLAAAPAAPPVPVAPAQIISVHDSASTPFRPRPEVTWSSLRFVAQVRHTYLVCEGPDGLYVLDQHAAAERVNFHRLRSAYRERNVAAQSLLFPLTFELSGVEANLVDEYAAEFASVGLDVRLCGPAAVAVHTVPQLLREASPERLVRDLLSEVSRSGGRGFSDAIDLALAQMACHGSIRAGDILSPDEATALLRALDGADFAGHCPHGRPVVTYTTWAELERKVGRR